MKYNNYSVLMSVYYKENPEWLRQCINSMLNQTKKTNDFVIVEDGILTKELEQVIVDYEKLYPNIFNIVRYKKNRGLGVVLNETINYCKNEIIVRMDSDDISDNTRCEKELRKINEGYDIVGSNIIEFEGEINNVISKKVMPENNNEIIGYAKFRNPFNHPSLMIKKSLILKAGNYQCLYRLEDYDLWLRCLALNAKCCNIQEYLVFMRTNKEFYKRRGGGMKCFKSYFVLRTTSYKRKQINFIEFLLNIIIAFIKCYSPYSLKKILYTNILREKI